LATAGREAVSSGSSVDVFVGDAELYVTIGLVDVAVDLPPLTISVETSLKPTCRDTLLFLVARPQLTD